MMRKIFSSLVIISLITAAAWHIKQRIYPKDDFANELQSLKKVLPSAEFFSAKFGNPLCYEGYHISPQGKQETKGLAFLTTDLAPEVKGYAGPIKIIVGMTTQGKLTEIEIISHQETPSYVQGINEDWFKEQFKGKSISDPFKIDEDLDGISRATVTVSAIARGIKKSGVLVARERLGLKVADVEANPWQRLNLFKLGLLAILIGAAIIAVFCLTPVLRYSCLLFAIFLLGYFYPVSLSMVNIVNLITYRLPEFIPNMFWYVLLAVTLISTLFWGRVYCGYLCPFGALSEFIDKIMGRRLSFSEDKNRQNYLWIKYIVLWLLLLLALLLGSNVADYEPFGTIFTLKSDTAGWLFLVIVLVACLFIPRFFCRYLCAVGATLGLISRFSLKKLSIKKGCKQCGVCRNICPLDAIQPLGNDIQIKPQECIQCYECRLGCPENQIGRS